jgi:hypothetical protein
MQCFVAFQEAVLARDFKQPEIMSFHGFQSAVAAFAETEGGLIGGFVMNALARLWREIYTSTSDGRNQA